MYDVNGDGVISRDDMLKTLRRSGKTSKKILNASSKYLKELGKERTANISKKLDDIMEDRCLYLMVEEVRLTKNNTLIIFIIIIILFY